MTTIDEYETVGVNHVVETMLRWLRAEEPADELRTIRSKLHTDRQDAGRSPGEGASSTVLQSGRPSLTVRQDCATAGGVSGSDAGGDLQAAARTTAATTEATSAPDLVYHPEPDWPSVMKVQADLERLNLAIGSDL